MSCVIPIEIGATKAGAPFLAAVQADNSISWVVDGEGAGRAVPDLPQTSCGGSLNLAVSPGSLANSAGTSTTLQSATLTAGSATHIEAVAGGIIAAFGSFAGIALGFSNATSDLARYFNAETGKSTGSTVSVIKVNAAPSPCKTTGMVVSFARLLSSIGNAGALPYPQELESGI